MTLIRIKAGSYRTSDGRFLVRNAHDPSGPTHVRYAGQDWVLTDANPRTVGDTSRRYHVSRHATLSDAKERIFEITQ